MLTRGRTQFKVISTMDAGHGLHIVQLKEIEPKHPLIEKPRIIDGTRVEWASSSESKDPPKLRSRNLYLFLGRLIRMTTVRRLNVVSASTSFAAK